MIVKLDVFPLPDWVIVTSPFGMRWGRLHRGVDFGSPDPVNKPMLGVQVRAPFAGKVTTGFEAGGAGLWAWVEASDGRGLFKSFHHSKALVERGFVSAGEPIALVGSSGVSTGPHAHLELWVNGEVIDPLQSFLAVKRSVDLGDDEMPSQEYFEVKFAELHQHISKERETLMSELAEVAINTLRGNLLTVKEVRDQLIPIAEKLGVHLPEIDVNQ